MPKGNFLAQFGGEHPTPTLWCVEICVREPAYMVMSYIAPCFTDAVKLVSRLRKKHPTADVKIVGDIFANT